MSVLQSTYYENLPDLDRYGNVDYSDAIESAKKGRALGNA